LVLERQHHLVTHDIPLPVVLASGRYPFADLPRRCVGLDEAGDLLATMAGERAGVPPVHGVVTP
jgi:alcohol dehydrogenase